MTGADSVKLRLDGKVQTVSPDELSGISEDAVGIIRTVIGEYGYLIHD